MAYERNGAAAQIDTAVAPSGTGCLECDRIGGWWVHLRRCATCGHIGCGGSSLHPHSTADAEGTGARDIPSFQPGQDRGGGLPRGAAGGGRAVPPPPPTPSDQSVPGPADRLPEDWEAQLDAARRGGA